MKDINFISLDLEMNQPTGSIIQVGFVVGNLLSGGILERHCYEINVNEILSPYIKTLTGITQEQVDAGKSLKEVYEILKDTHKKYSCFINPVTWGGGDSEFLRSSLKLEEDIFVFGRRWIDCKTLYISLRLAQNLPTQGGLAKAISREGVHTFQGRKHNALCDAENTFLFYRYLVEKLK